MNSSNANLFVSIILVNWNGKKWLKRCLESLNNQTYNNMEIIIVDNASIDGSVEYIKTNFPKVRIIKNKENLGYPKAANIGIKLSKGTHLLLINNDTWVEKSFLDKLTEIYINNDFDVISPIVREYSGKKSFIKLPGIDPTGSVAYFYNIGRKDKLFYLSSSYFCSKEVYLETGGFDDNYFAYYEDVDWFWRLQLLDKSFGYAEGVYIYHEGAGSTGSGIKYKMFLWRNQNALQTLIKNYSALILLLILPIYIIQNLFELVFFLAILKFDIAFSYIQGWWFNIINIKKILRKRAWIQKRRKISDIEIMKKMYWGPAKLRMLINYKRI